MKETTTPLLATDRNYNINAYQDRHERHKHEVKESESEILFIGDSLIEHMYQTEIWDQFSQMHALNFGMSGDKTQNVIWRLVNGELDFEDNRPKVVVLLIGTNNTESESEVVEGILECVRIIHEKLPLALILVISLFPKSLNPCAEREKLARINVLLKEIITDKKLPAYMPDFPAAPQTRLIDLDPGFLRPPTHSKSQNNWEQTSTRSATSQSQTWSTGKLDHNDFYDYLHLSKRGYEKAFTPLLKALKEYLYYGRDIESGNLNIVYPNTLHSTNSSFLNHDDHHENHQIESNFRHLATKNVVLDFDTADFAQHESCENYKCETKDRL